MMMIIMTISRCNMFALLNNISEKMTINVPPPPAYEIPHRRRRRRRHGPRLPPPNDNTVDQFLLNIFTCYFLYYCLLLARGLVYYVITDFYMLVILCLCIATISYLWYTLNTELNFESL